MNRANNWSYCLAGVLLFYSPFVVFAQTNSPPKTPALRPAPPVLKRTPSSTRAPRLVNKRTPLKSPFLIGVALCKKSHWEQALSFFVKSKQLLPRLAREDRARLFLYLGIIHANLLRAEKSSSSFVKALLVDPCIALSADLDLSPQIQQRFQNLAKTFQPRCEQEREAARKAKVASRTKVPGREPAPKVKRIPKQIVSARAIRLSAWLVIGSGVLSLSSACVVGALSVVDELQRNQQPLTSEGTGRYLELDRRARDRALIANILFGASGALLFTGLALHVSQWLKPGPPPDRVKFRFEVPGLTLDHPLPTTGVPSTLPKKRWSIFQSSL